MVGGLGQRPCTLPDTHSRDVVMLDRGQRSQAAVGSPARPPPPTRDFVPVLGRADDCYVLGTR